MTYTQCVHVHAPASGSLPSPALAASFVLLQLEVLNTLEHNDPSGKR
jgi:hypothetical protein